MTRAEYSAANMSSHPIISKLSRALSLEKSCGFIRMTRLIRENDNAPPTSGKANDWVPLSVHFGLPLFSLELNRQVCARIQQKQLFGAANLEAFTTWSRELSLSVLDFISQCQASNLYTESPMPLTETAIPFPTSTLLFSGTDLWRQDDW